jgi:AmiR/NasT family two-component response regulator
MKSSRPPAGRLRVLIVNEDPQRIDLLAEALIGLGHAVLVRDASLVHGPETGDDPADVALVGRSNAARDPLEIVTQLVHDGSVPTVVSLASRDPRYVAQAARAGSYGAIVGTDGRDLQSAIDVAVERFRQYRLLQDAFSRRAVLEQAKGILMARHGIDEDAAFELLRRHARQKSKKVGEIAAALVESHLLLVPADDTESSPILRS